MAWTTRRTRESSGTSRDSYSEEDGRERQEALKQARTTEQQGGWGRGRRGGCEEEAVCVLVVLRNTQTAERPRRRGSDDREGGATTGERPPPYPHCLDEDGAGCARRRTKPTSSCADAVSDCVGERERATWRGRRLLGLVWTPWSRLVRRVLKCCGPCLFVVFCVSLPQHVCVWAALPLLKAFSSCAAKDAMFPSDQQRRTTTTTIS